MKKNLWFCLLAALLLTLGIAASASAHATLDHSEPAPGSAVKPSPPVVKMWFVEALEPSNSWAKVTDPSGTEVDKGDSHVSPTDNLEMDVSLPPLPDGLYTVQFQTQSAVDGHVLNSSFTFTVGDKPLSDTTGKAIITLMQTNADPPPRLFDVLARAFNLLALSLLVGAVLFPLLVLLPAVREIQAPGSVIRNGLAYIGALISGQPTRSTSPLASQDELNHALTAWHARWKFWLRVFIVLYALASVVILIMQATEGGGTLADVPRTLFAERFGIVWFARIGCLLLLAVVIERAQWNWTTNARTPRALWLAILFTLALILTQSETSHGAAVTDPILLPLLADFVHVGGTAIWLGGLAQLLFTVPAFLGALPRPAQPRVLGAVIGCFSLTAFLTVGAVILSGAYTLLLHVNSLEAFFNTLYGTSLFIKFALILPLLALAALNLIVTRPNLAFDALERAQRFVARLDVIVGVEIAFVLLILVVVGFLTSIAPANVAYANQPALVQQTAKADDLTITLGVAPGKLGSNDFGVYVLGANGQPPDNVQIVRFYGTMQDMDMGTQMQDTAAQGNGYYTLHGDLLSMIGNWQLRVLVRRKGLDDTNVNFNLTALPANVPAILIPAPVWTRPDVQIGLVLTLAAFAFGTALVLLNKFKPRLVYATLGACIVVSLAGAFMVSSSVAAAPKPYVYKVPYAPDEARYYRDTLPPSPLNIAQGATMFQQNCAVCHGADAKGDGPAAANLYPPPVDLTVHAGLHPIGDLYYWITNGIQDSAMPAWSPQLTDTQRWQLVEYLRSLSPQAGFTPSP